MPMPEAGPYFAGLERMIEAFNGRDIDACVAGLNEHCQMSRGDGVSLTGRETATQWLTDLFTACPDAQVGVRQIVALPSDTMLLEWHLTGTSLGEIPAHDDSAALPANGGRIDVVGATLLTFDADALVSRIEARSDTTTLFSQMGLYGLPEPNGDQLADLAQRYTAAWCSHDAHAVAALFAEDSSFSINGGEAANGQEAIAEVVSGVMAAFPDLELLCDDVLVATEATVFQWRLKGTHSETSQRIHIGGFDVWQSSDDGLLTASNSYYDSAAYDDQIENSAVEYRAKSS